MLPSGAHRTPRAALDGQPGCVGGRSPHGVALAGDQTVKGSSVGQFERRVTKLSLALLLAGGGLISMGFQTSQTAHAAPVHVSHSSSVGGPTWYGAGSTTWMVEATIGIWPQPSSSNYCGVETATGMVNYDALNSSASMPLPANYRNGQGPVSAITADNQSQSSPTVSHWGHATYTNYTGGYSNIAADFGTDPRSVAYVAWNYSINNRWYHDYVYRWQFASATAPDMPTQALDATTLMARGLEAFGEPVVAFINSGAHAVLVSGVYSYSDPNNSFPAQIDELSIRDPMGTPSYSGTDTSHFFVSPDQWTRYGGNNGLGWHYDLWTQYYGNSKDPDPSVGIYSGAHWSGGYTWVQRDNNTSNATSPGEWDPDWAFNGYSGYIMMNP